MHSVSGWARKSFFFFFNRKRHFSYLLSCFYAVLCLPPCLKHKFLLPFSSLNTTSIFVSLQLIARTANRLSTQIVY